MKYAEIITRQFLAKSNLRVDCYCITDRPEEVGDWAIAITPAIEANGWWNKLNLFSPEMPSGWILYLDLDIVIQDNFDEEILWTISQNYNLACIADAINWMGVSFSSSMMILRSGAMSEIFEVFRTNRPDLENLPGGDQVWVGPQLKELLYINDQYPFLKKNLKYDLAENPDATQLCFPSHLDSRIKLVDCGGNPKPHQLKRLPYIYRNWHMSHASASLDS
jgi:hypothetical protein